jgi:nitrous oxidase accessory protein NosD
LALAGLDGGGILCDLEASPLIERNIISRNYADQFGGGIAVEGWSSPQIQWNYIHANDAIYLGAGIYCTDGRDVLVRGNVITENQSLGGKGGVYCVDSTIEISENRIESHRAEPGGYGAYGITTMRCVSPQIIENRISDNDIGVDSHEDNSPRFERNRIVGNDGALFVWDAMAPSVSGNLIAHNPFGGVAIFRCSAVEFLNNVISGNAASGASGLSLWQSSPVRVLNNTIVRNVSSGAKGIRCESCTGVEIANNIVWNATVAYGEEIKLINSEATVQHCLVRGGWPGEGNIDADPRLVDSGNDDFHVRFGSPCVDAGKTEVAGLPQLDFEGDARIENGDANPLAVVDIGADEMVPEVAVRFGTVNEIGESLANVLFVNGSAGNRRRVVQIATRASLTIDIVPPTAGPDPARFAVYGWIGEPTLDTLTPQAHGLGVMGHATPLKGAADDQPRAIWNNLGYFAYLGFPDYPSDPAPSVLIDRPQGLGYEMTITFQGFIEDNGSAADAPVSITNAVVVKVE